MKVATILKSTLVVFLLLVPVIAVNDEPAQVDNSYEGMPDPRGSMADSVPVFSGSSVSVEAVAAKIEVKKTDFVAESDGAVFAGSKSGQLYHILESGDIEPVITEEDRSNWKYGKIHPAVTKSAANSEEVEVVISLSDKALHKHSKSIKGKHLPAVEEMAETIKALFEEKRGKGNIRYRSDEKHVLSRMAFTKDENDFVKVTNKEIDSVLDGMKKEVAEETKKVVAVKQGNVIKLIERVGGRITAKSYLANCIGAVIPAEGLDAIAWSPFVKSITPENHYTLDLDESACLLGTADWWNGGYDGWNYDAALLDSGIREDHVYLKYRTPPSSDERPIYKKTSGYSGSHGTRTIGVIASSHSTYSGIAYGLDAIFDARAHNNMAESELMENMDWVLNCPLTAQSPEVVNNSYSLYYLDVEHGPFERFVDAVVDDLYVMITKSAGNAGTEEIGYPQSHNHMSAANLDIKDTCTSTDDVITSSSSRGPTLSGLRKPDITAPGTDTYSTDIASTTAFADHGGTSAAAPHVAGAILLLEDGGNHNPKAQKAVLINTATTWSDGGTLTSYGDDGPIDGDHWDETYGWGVMDLDHAHFHRSDYFSDSVIARNDTATDDDYKMYKGRMYNNDKATVVWHRRAVYNDDSEPTVYYTVTDLNVRLYDEDDGSLVDDDMIHQSNNVHQVSCDATRDTVIKVYSWSTSINGASSENYVLATEENFEQADPPSFSVSLSMPSVVYFNMEFTVTATVLNNGDVAAHNNQVTLSIPAGFVLVSGTSTQNIGKLEGGFSGQAQWTVRSSNVEGGYSLSATNSSACYLETYTATGFGLIEVGLSGLPNLTDTTPSGWDYPIVPRDTSGATSTYAPVTATLPGNTHDTYYNWAWINDSAVAAGSHNTAVFLDEAVLFYSTVSLGAGAVQQYRNIDGIRVVPGGRHTLYYTADRYDDVLESHEGDNSWGRQFVWSPLDLGFDSPVTRSAPSARAAWGPVGGWYNNDGFSFLVQQVHPDRWWSCVAAVSSDPNTYYGMRLWDIGNYTGSLAGFGSGYLEWSMQTGDATEFVVVNDNIAVAGTYYAGILNDNDGSGDYRIEHATSTKIYPRPGTQWNGIYNQLSNNVADIYEVYLNAGEYFFYLDQTAGTADLGMALFDDETTQAKAGEHLSGAYTNALGNGQDEWFQVTIPDDGYHGLVIFKDGSGDYDKSHSYRIAVGPPLCTVLKPNGGETLKAGDPYTISWDDFGNQGENVRIEISRNGGSSWSLITSSTANDGSYKWTVSLPGSTQCRIRITSTSDPSYTDTSDADFTIDASGIPPDINLKEGGTDLPHKSDYDFGNVNIGYDKSVLFTIENLGGADLVLEGKPRVQVSGSDASYFTVTLGPSSPIGSMDSTTFEVTFIPGHERSYKAYMDIPSNDPDEAVYSISLLGECTRPQTFYVDDDAPNDPGPYDTTVSDPAEDGSWDHPFDMIQEAIDTAFEYEDTIIVLKGRYYENIDLKGKNVRLRSANPTDVSVTSATVIDGMGKEPVVTVDSGEDARCIIEGFTITNGGGRKVYFAGTSVLAGGGIFVMDSSPVIQSCVIVKNIAELGGGVYANNSNMMLVESSALRNIASNYHGGGIYICEFSRPLIEGCMIRDNVAGFAGGGFASQSGSSAMLRSDEIIGNRANSGGGVSVNNSSATTFKNCIISKNESVGRLMGLMTDGGGGMTLWDAPVTCENCVFYENTAAVEGGAIQCAYTDGVVLRNSIFWLNTAPAGEHIYLRYTQSSTSFPSTMTASYCDFENGKTGVVVDPGCTFIWGSGNFDKDPLFADAANNDYHLLSRYGRWDPSSGSWVYDHYTSVCIDLGDPVSDWSAELWPHGKRINVGAYGGTSQASMSGSSLGNIADLNKDGRVDKLDLRIFSGDWVGSDLLAVENMDRTGRVNMKDYSIFGANFGWEEP